MVPRAAGDYCRVTVFNYRSYEGFVAVQKCVLVGPQPLGPEHPEEIRAPYDSAANRLEVLAPVQVAVEHKAEILCTLLHRDFLAVKREVYRVCMCASVVTVHKVHHNRLTNIHGDSPLVEPLLISSRNVGLKVVVRCAHCFCS